MTADKAKAPKARVPEGSETTSPKKTKATWPELRLDLHSKIMDGLTNGKIAEHFGVSERTVIYWKKTLSRELFEKEDFDRLTWVSEQIASLKLARTEAFRNYYSAQETGDDPKAQKWFAMGFKAQIALTNLLISSGALEDKPLSPANLKDRSRRKAGEEVG
jgi:hypothetical protein